MRGIPLILGSPRGSKGVHREEGGAERRLFLPPCLLSLPASVLARPLPAVSVGDPRQLSAAHGARFPFTTVILPKTRTRQHPRPADEPPHGCARAAHTDRWCHTGHPCSVVI